MNMRVYYQLTLYAGSMTSGKFAVVSRMNNQLQVSWIVCMYTTPWKDSLKQKAQSRAKINTYMKRDATNMANSFIVYKTFKNYWRTWPMNTTATIGRIQLDRYPNIFPTNIPRTPSIIAIISNDRSIQFLSFMLLLCFAYVPLQNLTNVRKLTRQMSIEFDTNMLS